MSDIAARRGISIISAASKYWFHTRKGDISLPSHIADVVHFFNRKSKLYRRLVLPAVQRVLESMALSRG